MPDSRDLRRYVGNLCDEVDSAHVYRRLADREANPELAGVYRRLAEVEDRHAAFWAKQLVAAGATFGLGRLLGVTLSG